MTLSIQELMRTDYYHPSLNSAVFDGALRIYFAQSQESLALSLYFKLQKHRENLLAVQDDSEIHRYFVIMLYPQADMYSRLSNSDGLFRALSFGQDLVILTHGQTDESQFDQLVRDLSFLLEQSEGVYSDQVQAQVV